MIVEVLRGMLACCCAGAPVAAPKPQPPPAPAGPPANITLATADTSKVAPELRPIVNTLLALHQVLLMGGG